MSLYEQTIKIDFETAKKLNYWLKNNGIFFTNSYERLNEDETFVKTAKFEENTLFQQLDIYEASDL